METKDNMNCVIADGVYYSKASPDRAVKECLFGFALYEKRGERGFRVAVGDQAAAANWLEGKPLEECGAFLCN